MLRDGSSRHPEVRDVRTRWPLSASHWAYTDQPRKSGSGKDDADCDDIGRRYNRKPTPTRCARATARAALQRGLPALPARLGCCLQAVVRLQRAHSAVGYRPEGWSLAGWEAMWLLAPGRAR